MSEPTLSEIAVKINQHLRRFESNYKINKLDPEHKTRPYYHAVARQAGSRVRIRYISYQTGITLVRADAETYLAWLDAGNIGKHWKAVPNAV